MKTMYAVASAALVLSVVTLNAKPPAAKNANAAPTSAPVADPTSANPIAKWLLQQDGRESAITLPLREVIHAVTGKNVLPFDPTNPDDKAFLARLSDVMERVLPRINRPDSPAHAAAHWQGALDEVVTRIEQDIVDVYSPAQDFADIVGRDYPSFRLLGKNGRPYYLSVALYTTGEREQATRSHAMNHVFRIDPVESGNRIAMDACCLLIGIECNGKMGGGMAFLNWDVVDVSNVPVHAAINFDASAADVYHPGAVLTDGRKGSD